MRGWEEMREDDRREETRERQVVAYARGPTLAFRGWH
jgi:hypothetical protein